MQTGRKVYLTSVAVERERMLSVAGDDALEPIAGRVRRDLVRVVVEFAGS